MTMTAGMSNHRLDERLNSLLGVVLCGGRATRMGGIDKGLADFQGKPLVSYGITALSDCGQIVINANRHQTTYQKRFNLPVVDDDNKHFAGPLAGMLVALRYAAEHGFAWIITVPCDAPLVTPDYVQTMWQAAKHSHDKILMAHDGFRQPVFALLHVSLTTALESFLQGPHKKIVVFYQQMGFQTVDCSHHPQWFVNLNTMADLTTPQVLSQFD